MEISLLDKIKIGVSVFLLDFYAKKLFFACQSVYDRIPFERCKKIREEERCKGGDTKKAVLI